MKRRHAIQSLIGIPAAAALPLGAAPDTPAQRPAAETPKTPVTVADAVGNGMPRFFTAEEFGALERLGEILLPPYAGRPGAREAEAAAFLDFLLANSPADRVELYRQGLAKLNSEARRRYQKSFAELTAEQAAPILAPLEKPWSYHPPEDPLARFLVAVKDDVFLATTNSREWAAVMARRSRRAGGLGTYWYSVED